MIRIELEERRPLMRHSRRTLLLLPRWWGGKVSPSVVPGDWGPLLTVVFTIETKGWRRPYDALRMRAITQGLKRRELDYIVDRTDEEMKKL